MNSLVVGSLSGVLATALGFMAALCSMGLGERWRRALVVAGLVALALPPFLVTNTWLHFLGQNGTLRGLLPVNLFSLHGTVWILSLMLWPVPFLSVSAAWQRIEPNLLESDPAVKGWALISGILWPAARVSAGQSALIAFVLAMNNFAVPAILQTKILPAEIWIRFSTSFDTLGALRLCWPLAAALLIFLVIPWRTETPWPRFESVVSSAYFRRQLGTAAFGLSAALTGLVVLLSAALPLFQILSARRTWIEFPGALSAGLDSLWHSVFYAGMSASLVLLAGIVLSKVTRAGTRESIHARWEWMRRAGGGFLWLPFLLPGVFIGIGLILLFNHPWSAAFYQSAGIVVVAFCVRYLALGWHGAAAAFHGTSLELAESARLDGASRWQTLRFVEWPQVSRRVAGIWYVVFLLCLWDVESMILVFPPGGETLAQRIFNLLHYGHNAQVNALCFLLLGLALAPLAGWWLFRAARQAFRSGARSSSVLVGSLVPGVLILLASPVTSCTPRNDPNRQTLTSGIFKEALVIANRGAGVGQVNKPRSVAVDARDNIFVVDMTGRVQKFTPSGAFALSWQMPQTDLGKPKGMCRDREGNIVVIEPHYQRVNHFSPEGKLVRQWGQKGTNAGQFTLPRAAAVNSQGEIVVSEYGAAERVQRFSPDGATLLGSIGHAGTGPGEFNRPEGLCVDSSDKIYVADSCNHRIQIFTREGQFLRTYGKPGKGPGELSYPYDICVDSAGRQYVCEFGNSRIQVFDASDKSIEVIGGPGAAPGQFSNPWGIALDSHGDLYVADSQNHRLQKLLRSAAPAQHAWLECPASPGLCGERLFHPNALNGFRPS
jgi:ABC-type Fe3+ transport system permease subunit/DNA-binding beta-propeller fold protein YncE